jgi:hypothetical protein
MHLPPHDGNDGNGIVVEFSTKTNVDVYQYHENVPLSISGKVEYCGIHLRRKSSHQSTHAFLV